MIEAVGLRWLLTAAFAVAGLVCLVRCARPDRPTESPVERLGALLQALMCAAMVAMVWPWGASLPVVPQVVLFTAATVWFLGVLAFSAGRPDRAGLVHQVLMMVTMVWMVAVMPLTMRPAAGQPVHGGSGHAGHGASGHGSGDAAPSAAVPAHVAVVGALVALAMLGWAWWWLARALDNARAAPSTLDTNSPRGRTAMLRRGRCTAEAAMSMGMAVAAFVIAT